MTGLQFAPVCQQPARLRLTGFAWIEHPYTSSCCCATAAVLPYCRCFLHQASEEDLAAAALKEAVQKIKNSPQARAADSRAAEIAAEEGLPVTSSSSDLLDLLLQKHKIRPASLTDHDRQWYIQGMDEGR